ncbi:signal transduction histidine kinase [Bacillus ectoiniformans]|uniref:ATP-binding protein n=1 Tax=Bacillus ectoiniformans TaxID=1494429 RepID=UPI00195A4B4E|nr:ATP-binding protein [Bacillus ectoiniformans]MBM7648422.1 signal transduction histidine kinase [Bacillus ectoiniformans]
MKLRLNLILLFCGALVFLVMFSVYFIQMSKVKEAVAVSGVVDLKELKLAENEAVKLHGEWEFIPNRLVDSEGFETADEKDFVSVPSLWSHYTVKGQSVPKHMAGSYRLRVKLPASQQVLGIKTSNIRMSHALYVNGKLAGNSGKPSESGSLYQQRNTPYTAYFYADKQTLDIVVQVANFHYASGGGIMGSIYLGSSQSISNLTNTTLAYDWIMCAAFSMMAIYFYGFYLHMQQHRELFYLALFSVSIFLYTLTHGEKILSVLLEQMPYDWFERLQGVSTIAIGVFLLLYFVKALPDYTPKATANFLVRIGYLLIGTALLPVHINSHLQYLYSVYLLSVFLIIIWIQVRAVRSKVTGSSYLVISSVAIILYFVAGTFNVSSETDLTVLPPILPFAYLLMLSLFMALRFSDTYKKNEMLSEALLKADEFKDEFLAKTSHEFRTPLHGVSMILQSMLDSHEEQGLTDEHQRKLGLVVQIAKRLSALVNDILDLSKLKQGELAINTQAVDIKATAGSVVEIFSYMVKANVSLKVQISDQLSPVIADKYRMRQVFYNLIDNAVKHTSSGEITIYAYEKDERIITVISDTGSGIEQELLPTLFDPYQQSATSREDHSGIGLGLTITKQLVELQSGEIWVESEAGAGTSVYISLPVSKESEVELDWSPTDHSNPQDHLQFPYLYAQPGKKVMIAEDDAVILSVMVETLQEEGYYVIALSQGTEVVKMLETHPDIDLLILDIMMPGLSGYEVAREVRKRYSMTELPLLMLTAAIHPEDMIAAFDAGANDFLQKPLDYTELKTRMRNLLLIKESAQSAVQMEVAFLQAQIRPHFLYNVLNSILALSYVDVDLSRKLITDFATFLRGSFHFSNTQEKVPLSKELALIKVYVEIEKIRFPESFEFIIQMDAAVEEDVPPLILQPLIENAIRHGVSKKQVKGEITLTISKDEKLEITIEDNGVGMSEAKLNELLTESSPNGIGVANIVKRIRKIHGASITITSELNQGTAITISIPVKEQEDA